MARNTYPWFKFYSEFLHDPKVRRLSIEERYIWVGLLCLAAESPVRGELWLTKKEPLSCMDIAMSLDMDVDDERILKALNSFEKLEMISREGSPLITRIINWKERQGSDSPDAIRERVAKHRDKNESNENVTDLKQVSNTNVTYRVEESRGEEIKIKREKKPEYSISYLLKLPLEDLKEFTDIYHATETEIKRKAEKMQSWCVANGRKYKNYKAFLRNGIDKDFRRKEDVEKEIFKPPESNVTDDQAKKNREKLAEMKKNLFNK